MSDVWQVLGLFSIDGKLVKKLDAVKDDPNQLTEETRKLGFQLSRFEIAEIRHVLQDGPTMGHFKEIRKRWNRPPCDFALIHDSKYSHVMDLWRDPDIRPILESKRDPESNPKGDLNYIRELILNQQNP